jgi:hypothetical protein
MRFLTSSLSVLGTLVVSGSDLVVADQLPVSPAHINDQGSPQTPFPAGGAVIGDFQLVDGHVEAKTNPEQMHTASSCFPALDFVMPSKTPASLSNWWCDPMDEYAFLGFSYEVSACEPLVAFIYRP